MGLFGSKGNENIGVKSLGIRSFIGEVFGRKIAALPDFAMEEQQVDFLLVDNDVLVTQGFSNYNMKHFGPQKYYELAIRVPFNWDYASSDKHETWIVELLQTIVKEAIEGNRPVSDNYLKVFDKPFHYSSYLNSVTLCHVANKIVGNGKEINFMMVVPLYESELVDNHYLEPSFDLKGLAWQRACLARGNEYFETLDDFYPYECTMDAQAMEEYEAVKRETLPDWNDDRIGCRVSSGVLDYNNKVAYMYRAEPEGDFSGW
ncbi:MAG: suppressor of fused domain protein, partial [Bacteroidales bacterium]|nr:suppressor of fused domain protein [Bacteroidales bacterium]